MERFHELNVVSAQTLIKITLQKLILSQDKFYK